MLSLNLNKSLYDFFFKCIVYFYSLLYHFFIPIVHINFFKDVFCCCTYCCHLLAENIITDIR